MYVVRKLRGLQMVVVFFNMFCLVSFIFGVNEYLNENVFWFVVYSIFNVLVVESLFFFKLIVDV